MSSREACPTRAQALLKHAGRHAEHRQLTDAPVRGKVRGITARTRHKIGGLRQSVRLLSRNPREDRGQFRGDRCSARWVQRPVGIIDVPPASLATASPPQRAAHGARASVVRKQKPAMSLACGPNGAHRSAGEHGLPLRIYRLGERWGKVRLR